MKIKVSLPIILDVTDDRGKEILNGDKTSLLSTVYTPDRTFENNGRDGHGNWWIQGECTIENGTIIKV